MSLLASSIMIILFIMKLNFLTGHFPIKEIRILLSSFKVLTKDFAIIVMNHCLMFSITLSYYGSYLLITLKHKCALNFTHRLFF